MHNIQVISRKPPSYLQRMLKENFCLKLVFLKGEKVESPKFSNNFDVLNNTSVLELTGNPLETDLAGNDSFCSGGIPEKPPSWSPEEAQQYPLTLENARSFINSHLKNTRKNEAIYCICDGSDAESTIGLGAKVSPQRINRIILSALPCFNANGNVSSLEYMKKDHIRNVGKNAQISVSSTKNYDLFGYNLQNCDALSNAFYNGNISLQLSSTEISSEPPKKSQIQMNCQVIIGHKNSPLLTFWEELCSVQAFIKLLESPELLNESTIIIPENNLDYTEITSSISEFFTTVTNNKRRANEDFNLNNLRQLDVYDHLWSILKHSFTLSDLRCSIHFLFEHVAVGEFEVWENDDSVVGKILNDLVNGELAVPTLSFSQSLELVIELGLEKLRKDYTQIISNFAMVAKDAVVKKWSEFSNDAPALKFKQSKRGSRRSSFNPKVAFTEATFNKLKLSFLYSMHKVCEFIFLCKDNLSLNESLDSYCEALCDIFLVNFQKVVQSGDFKQPCLNHFSLNLSSAEISYIKDKSPTSFCVRLSSAIEYSEVTTVFYFSKHPIVPPCVFKDYEIPDLADDASDRLFGVKLLELVHLL